MKRSLAFLLILAAVPLYAAPGPCFISNDPNAPPDPSCWQPGTITRYTPAGAPVYLDRVTRTLAILRHPSKGLTIEMTPTRLTVNGTWRIQRVAGAPHLLDMANLLTGASARFDMRTAAAPWPTFINWISANVPGKLLVSGPYQDFHAAFSPSNDLPAPCVTAIVSSAVAATGFLGTSTVCVLTRGPGCLMVPVAATNWAWSIAVMENACRINVGGGGGW